LTFDRDVRDVRLEASNTGALQPVAARYEPRNGRFDVSFEVVQREQHPPAKLRFTGIAIETVEAAVLTRNVERSDILKSGRRGDRAAPQGRGRRRRRGPQPRVGMQMRKQLRAGQAIKVADLAKPDLVQRDDNVTLIFESAGSISPFAARRWRRHRGRRRQRHQSAIEAHGLRRRHRPRPGRDFGRNAKASRHRCIPPMPDPRAGCAGFDRHQQSCASVSKSRVM
jgi:hypothetical protein